jgi:hypothetical protein
LTADAERIREQRAHHVLRRFRPDRWSVVMCIGASARLALARAIVLLALSGSACATPAQRSADSATAEKATPTDDSTRVARLEREARALARTTGCGSASACRIAPLGWRACGGPRDYVAYCAASTDSVALFRKLDELKQAEKDYNAKSGMAGSCQMRLPPGVTFEAGSCTVPH